MNRDTPVPLFIDTGGFYAAYVEDDTNHDRAAAVFKAVQAGERYGPIFTSRYVLAELATVILYHKSHRRAVSTINEIRSSETINILPVTERTFDAAYDQFAQYSDQEIAFVDHLGGSLAREYDIGHVFTFDPDDFRTLEFTVVPDDTGEA
ncbi:PIN domain protein [Halalkalicoccus paucihalophilus]|uniref:PIN domain protein n=1 Tax=Halalkalicoccus paucihalophilus TaxID=1008153 RepID=A0A151A9S7_9EURY|nr:PIN domain-containing protein [Halalkalicoccus paucihalophilus]KYH24354.1 PIN domain protein [Halalkalicoccus paucihalophilus]